MLGIESDIHETSKRGSWSFSLANISLLDFVLALYFVIKMQWSWVINRKVTFLFDFILDKYHKSKFLVQVLVS